MGAMPPDEATQIGWQYGDNQWNLRVHLSWLTHRTQMHSTTVAKVSYSGAYISYKTCRHGGAGCSGWHLSGRRSQQGPAAGIGQRTSYHGSSEWLSLTCEIYPHKKNSDWQRTLCYASNTLCYTLTWAVGKESRDNKEKNCSSGLIPYCWEIYGFHFSGKIKNYTFRNRPSRWY